MGSGSIMMKLSCPRRRQLSLPQRERLRIMKFHSFLSLSLIWAALASGGSSHGDEPSAVSEEIPPARSPEEALRAFRLKPGMRVELVAAEPLVVDPVAIDFGGDGRLWVCEMRDYPTGIDGRWTPGGVIKVLEDQDGDGRYDRATNFLEGLPFPTGVMAWRKG